MIGKRIQLSLMLALTVCLVCCQGGHDNDRKPVSGTLQGTELAAQTLEGYKIVCAYDDYLFLQESRDTSRLVVYRVEGDSLNRFRGLIDRGRGPREFYYTEFSLYGDTLFVCNGDPSGLKQIFGISLKEMSQIDDRSGWREYAFPDQYLMTWDYLTEYGPGRFVVAAGEAETREILSLADCITGERVPLRWYPPDSTDATLYSKQIVYMNCKLRSQGDRVCYAHSYARYMFIGRVEDEALVEESMIYSSLPKYEMKADENVRYLKDGENGIDIYSTSDYIFAQVGRTRKEVEKLKLYKGYPDLYFDEVEVYDWDGRFVANFQTDRPFWSFSVTPDSRFLYVMTMDLETLENVIVRYELPL